jgi:hypothetical protein
MRRSSRGIVATNFKLSLSHNPRNGQTCGLLLGCSNLQTSFIVNQIQTCQRFAWHPLLLPTLLTSNIHQVLDQQTEDLWERLIRAETNSGQTGAPAINILPEENDFDRIIKDVLGVIQLAAAWESKTNALLLGIESIKDGFGHVNSRTPSSRLKSVDAVEDMLTEYLDMVAHKSKLMLWDLQYVNKRGQAQMTAVSALTS